ncbi:MAG: alpha/beta hydrolase [Verrucomicrobia bacterium]|nr:alpha/beta hydrolase [Verrucomicrobiota bacterium]
MKTTRRLLIRLAALLSLLAVTTDAQQPPRHRPQGPPPLPEGVRALRDIEYVSGGGKAQSLDLYLPKSDRPLPLIIWVHGGAFRAGDKAQCPAMALTRRGYAAASLNYRLSGQAIFPAAIEDCKAAVRWLRAHAKEYNLDPDHFGAWGSSAGGHLVALLGTSGGVKTLEGSGGNLEFSSRVQAVCDWFGPTDFLQMEAHALTPGKPFSHDAADSPESLFIGGAIQENKEKAQRANPITYATPDDPPFLIMHGDRDPLVPHHQSELLAAALKKAGVEVTFHTVKDAGHGFGGPEIMRMVEEFFDKHLKKSAAP